MDDITLNQHEDDESVSVVLPENLLEEIDAQVGGAFTDRSDFVLSAVRHYVEHMHDVQFIGVYNIGY